MGVDQEDPRAWLRPNPLLQQQHNKNKQQTNTSMGPTRRPKTEAAHGKLHESTGTFIHTVYRSYQTRE